ncbi:hypothetical protein MKEN_01389700 [Mycena kentingensis (nom. inval.)]|nr:hypothetical protein MKEN_01389700 [Mycena kentingensis (nom. inval.)]
MEVDDDPSAFDALRSLSGKVDVETMMEFLRRIVSSMPREHIPTFSSSTNASGEVDIDVHFPHSPSGRSIFVRFVSVADIFPAVAGGTSRFASKDAKRAFKRLARAAHDLILRSEPQFAVCDVVVIFQSGDSGARNARIFQFRPTGFVATRMFDWLVEGAKICPSLFHGTVNLMATPGPLHPINRLTSLTTILHLLPIHGDLCLDPERRSTLVVSCHLGKADAGKCVEVMNPVVVLKPALMRKLQPVHRVLFIGPGLSRSAGVNSGIPRVAIPSDLEFSLAGAVSRGNYLTEYLIAPSATELGSESVPVQLPRRVRLHAGPTTCAFWKFPSALAMMKGTRDVVEGKRSAWRAGILHGDITKTNLVFDEADEDRGLVLDFDSAKSVGLRVPIEVASTKKE